MNVTLYRGIAVGAEDIDTALTNIRIKGLAGDEGDWKRKAPNVQKVTNNIDSFYSNDNLRVDDIYDEADCLGIFACGDEKGAKYYSLNHNATQEKSASIIISFEAKLEDIYVDCRDFLVTAFRSFDRESHDFHEKQLKELIHLFGASVERYFAKSCESDNHEYRTAMANLACFDTNVVKAHYDNDLTIEGRCGTQFQSAFTVKGPILPDSIVDCKVVNETYNLSLPYISLPDFIKGKFPLVGPQEWREVKKIIREKNPEIK